MLTIHAAGLVPQLGGAEPVPGGAVVADGDRTDATALALALAVTGVRPRLAEFR